MVDNSFYDDIFTKEELASAKDNFFEVLGELYNGEALQIILSETEREINKDYKITLPSGYEEFDKRTSNNNKNSFSLILNLFISLIMKLNPRSEEAEEIYLLKISIITMICLNGSLTSGNNFNTSDIKFDKDYIKNNKGKIKKEEFNLIDKIIKYFPLANNFIAFSTLNYIRFNHHFPNEKVHLMKKALMSFSPELVKELIDEENKDTFYDCLVTPSRINNELVFYEKILNTKFEKNHENKFKYFKLLGTVPTEFKEDIIKIRSTCTPNGFLVLDLIKAMIDDMKAKNIIFLLPNIDIFSKLMNIREHIRLNPFGYHNSKIFFHCMAKDFDSIHDKFLSYMSIVGGLIYSYTENMEESILQAKCRLKYKNKVNLKDEKLVQLIFALANTAVKYEEKELKILKEKLNVTDITIDENLDIKLENERITALFNFDPNDV